MVSSLQIFFYILNELILSAESPLLVLLFCLIFSEIILFDPEIETQNKPHHTYFTFIMSHSLLHY